MINAHFTVCFIWIPPPDRIRVWNPTTPAINTCLQYHAADCLPVRYRSSRSPMTASLFGLDPKWRSNHLAIVGGRLDLMPSLLAVPATVPADRSYQVDFEPFPKLPARRFRRKA